MPDRIKLAGWLGDIMDNSAKTYFMVVALIILGLVLVGNKFISPEKRSVYPGVIREGIAKPLTIVNVPREYPESGKTLDLYLVGTFGAALLIGCLAGLFIRRRPRRSRSSLPRSNDLLSSLSSSTGINEYELFRKAAENWNVSAGRIDEDFRRYMASHRLPYYVTDYARKYRFQTDRLIQPKKVEPSSRSDWIKALLVFPGSFVFLYVAIILLP